MYAYLVHTRVVCIKPCPSLSAYRQATAYEANSDARRVHIDRALHIWAFVRGDSDVLLISSASACIGWLLDSEKILSWAYHACAARQQHQGHCPSRLISR